VPKTSTRACRGCGRTLPLDGDHFRALNDSRTQRRYFTHKCKQCLRDDLARYREANPDWQRGKRKAANRRIKRRAMDAYGGKCACCGETELLFLAIDHIDGDGGKQRAEEGRGSSGSYFYRWLQDQGWPEGYRVLCFNCNFARHWNDGVCPHQQPVDEEGWRMTSSAHRRSR
jgi:hypothetical protein